MISTWTTVDVPPGNNASSPDAACQESGTAWRTPTQEDWSAIYKGGLTSGGPDVATANTWSWHRHTNVNTSGGMQIRPDNATTTLFLPANGLRHSGSGLQYYQSSSGYYWSSSIIATNAYYLGFFDSYVNPANNTSRAYGLALRCIKQH